ncbi:MAG: histidinol-phosphatase HisJ family protein [Clostridiales bacterium]|nr:histidinol-phosphatase HisJ family protein [Clostridiales bacterium]
MQLCDMHVHSQFSCDGVSAMEEICNSAIQKNLSHIAFTEHFDVTPELPDEKYYTDHEKERLLEFERLTKKNKKELDILFGIELGQPHHNPESAVRLLSENKFDFVLGSLHFYKSPTGQYHDVYFVDYSVINPSIMFSNYFTDMQCMVEYGGFDVIAHLDYPLRVLKEYIDRPTIKNYRDLVDLVLKIAVKKGIGLEIGTRGLLDWQQRVGPEEWVLKRYRELGGEIITTGSDSHSAEKVGYGIEEACAAAQRAGFSYITYFSKRKPVFEKIEF